MHNKLFCVTSCTYKYAKTISVIFSVLLLGVVIAPTAFASSRTTPFFVGETTDPGLDAQPCGPTDTNCFPSLNALQPVGTTTGSGGIMKFLELLANGVNYIGFRAPDALTGNTIWTLPAGDGSSGSSLTTNGSGNLSWVVPGSTGVTTAGYFNATSSVGYQQGGTTLLTASLTGFNTFLGFGVGTSTTSGLNNTFLGYQSGQANTTGSQNTANGYWSLFSNTTGSNNTANGDRTLYSNTTGDNNTANGKSALYFNTTGSQNTANGYGSLFFNTTGSTNTANGFYSLFSNTTGTSSTAIGYQAGYSNTTGYQNTFLGMNAGYTDGTITTTATLTNATAIGYNAQVTANNSLILGGTGAYAVNVGIGTTSPYAKLSVAGNAVITGLATASLFNATSSVGYQQGGTTLLTASLTGFNTFLGFGVGTSTTSGLNNTFLGYQSGQANTTGSNNTGNGYRSLFSNTTGYENTANGGRALYSNTTGYENTANGFESLFSNTTGSDNTANGYWSLTANTTGSDNTANGVASLYYNTTGTGNTALGSNALMNNTTGYYNIGIGYIAGADVTTGYDNIFLGHDVDTGGTSITTGYNNIGLGYNIKFPSSASSNMLNIGNFLFANLPATTTQITLTTQPLTGKLGVGTSSPYAKLTIWGSDTLSTSKALEVANSASSTLLTITNAGNVGIGTTSPYATLSVAGSTVLTGTTTIGVSSTAVQAGLQIGYGGLCVDNDGTCVASTTGRISAVSYTTGATDLAENYFSTTPLAAGNIVMIDNSTSTPAHITLGDATRANRILGIVSTKPAIILGLENDAPLPNQYPVALSGRVPVSVNLEHGPIKAGDRITISSTPGVGAKAVATSSLTVGIALEDFTGAPDMMDTMATDTILAFVDLEHNEAGLQLEHLVSLTGSSTDTTTSDTFVGRFFERMRVWLADTTNGIAQIAANIFRGKEFHAEDKLCIGHEESETCITKEQLDQLLQNQIASPATSTGSQ